MGFSSPLVVPDLLISLGKVFVSNAALLDAPTISGTIFTIIPEWILDADMSDRAVRLYGVLHRYLGRNETAWPSRQTLAGRLRCSTKSVDRALEELAGLGAVVVRHRYRSDGSQTSSDYLLVTEAPRHGWGGGAPPVSTPLATRVAVKRASEREPENKDILSEPEFGPDVETLCNELADSIEANGSKRPVVTKAWRVEMDRLLRLDGKTPTQVGNMIRWCQADPFWRSNILSVVKLRAKYDQMRLSAMRETKVGGDSDETKRVEQAKAEAKAWEDEVARRHEASTPMPAGFKAILRKGNRD